MIEFAEWLPDLPALENPGATVATNVLPNAKGYLPMPSFSTLTASLDARVRGFIALRDTDGNSYNYAGDATKLYELSNVTWTNVSISGGYTTGADEFWEFAKWGNKVLATNRTNDPQQLILGGANFSVLTTATKARHIAVVRDFVVLGNTNDSVDGGRPHRVRWSAIGDETSWTVSASTLADFQDLQGTGGAVQRIVGGEQGWVFQENSIWRMYFVGSPLAWQFDEVAPGYGTPSPASVVQVGQQIFFLGTDGFYVLRGGQVVPIGAGKVDKTFFNDMDAGEFDRVYGVADPEAKRVFWAYPGVGHSSGNPNRVLCYDWAFNRWSRVDQVVEIIVNSISEGFTLDGLDALSSSIDALADSLDSRAYTGGVINLSAFNTDHKMGHFGGAAMAATIETAEAQLTPGGRTFVRSVQPSVDGSSGLAVSVQIGARNRQQDAVSFNVATTTNAEGKCPVRSNARYHRARVTTSGDFTAAVGVDFEGTPEGNR